MCNLGIGPNDIMDDESHELDRMSSELVQT